VNRDGLPIKNIYPAWHVMLNRAGFGSDQHITPYSFRHTLAAELTASGISDEDIGRYLGHLPYGAKATTEIYAHRRPDYLRHATDVIDQYLSKTLTLAGLSDGVRVHH
jgi:site-specific recombinase XerD